MLRVDALSHYGRLRASLLLQALNFLQELKDVLKT